MRPKSIWIQLPGKKNTLWFSSALVIMSLLLWKGNVELNTPHTTYGHGSTREYWPRFNTMSLTANRRSFLSTVKSCQKVTYRIANVSQWEILQVKKKSVHISNLFNSTVNIKRTVKHIFNWCCIMSYCLQYCSLSIVYSVCLQVMS